MSDAFILGRKAGLLCLPPSLNPYPLGADYAQWAQGWNSAIGERFAGRNAERNGVAK